MKKGNIVLYKNQPALITAIQADKFEIELESGVKKVRGKDICLLSDGEARSLQAVLTASIPAVAFDDALTFFEGERPSFGELAELLWGTYPVEHSWRIWQALCSCPYFVCTNPAEPISIRSAEELEMVLRQKAQKEETERIHQRFIADLQDCLQHKKTIEKCPAYAPFFQELEALALGTSNCSKIVKEIKKEQTPEQAHEILLKTQFWTFEKNPYPTRFGHSLHSSKITIPEPVYPSAYLDLTETVAYAIDNKWSTDPDDAVAFDGTYLWVHIANPADTIQAGSSADCDACGRGATLYIPEGAARMLGEKAVDYFALGLDPVSYALSFRILLDENGEIADTALYRSRIKVERLSYEQADAQKDLPDLAPLFAIADKNRMRRSAAGAVSIDFPEVTIRLDTQAEGKKVTIEPVKRTEAADMIKEMMLLAGEAAARFAFKKEIPFQYISQEAPELPKKLPSGLAGEYKKRRAMRPRNVGTIPSMHAALGLAMYGQVTSPLRRYGDLVSHRQLLNFIDGKPLIEASELILNIAAADAAVRTCALAERTSRQHWTLVYLLQNPQWEGSGIVLELQGKKARIFIPELAYESEITLNAEAELNDSIPIKVHSIRLAYLQVHFVAI